MIFYRKHLEADINQAVFPGLQVNALPPYTWLCNAPARAGFVPAHAQLYHASMHDTPTSQCGPEIGGWSRELMLLGLQGGPHNHTISGLAVALRAATAPEFKTYQQQVIANARTLADRQVAVSGCEPGPALTAGVSSMAPAASARTSASWRLVTSSAAIRSSWAMHHRGSLSPPTADS